MSITYCFGYVKLRGIGPKSDRYVKMFERNGNMMSHENSTRCVGEQYNPYELLFGMPG